MAKESFKDLLESTYKLREADEVAPEEEEEVELEDDDDEDAEESLDDLPQGKGDYTADDLREIIDYVYEILDKEDDDELNDSVGEIGLDLIYEYADVFPATVLNQLVDDLKELFEIEDTMLESIVTEGFVKQKKGALAKQLQKKAKMYYKKNKAKLKQKAKKWRKSSHGKKVIALHKKLAKRLGSKKGFRLQAPEVA